MERMVAFDTPALCAWAKSSFREMSSGRGDRWCLSGSASFAGHSISSHCSGSRRALVVETSKFGTSNGQKNPNLAHFFT